MLPQKGALILLAPSLDEVALVELHNPPRTRRVPFGLNPLTFTRYTYHTAGVGWPRDLFKREGFYD